MTTQTDDTPPEDVDERFAWRLERASRRTRAERPVLLVDGSYTDGELAQASSALGQRVQRRP